MKLFKGHFGHFDHFKLGNVGVIDSECFRSTKGTLLLLDYDSTDFSWLRFASNVRVFRGSITVRTVSICPTKRGLHIIVEIAEKLNDAEKMLLEAILGDDIKRVALNFNRYLGFRGKIVPEFWMKKWNLLFTHKLD